MNNVFRNRYLIYLQTCFSVFPNYIPQKNISFCELAQNIFMISFMAFWNFCFELIFNSFKYIFDYHLYFEKVFAFCLALLPFSFRKLELHNMESQRKFYPRFKILFNFIFFPRFTSKLFSFQINSCIFIQLFFQNFKYSDEAILGLFIDYYFNQPYNFDLWYNFNQPYNFNMR